jgi:hypothetical protein
MKMLPIVAALTLSLWACTAAVNPAADKSAPGQAATVDLAPQPSASHKLALETDEGVAFAAGVASVQTLQAPEAKLFTTAGGDPAINGLYTYYAQYSEEERGWRSWKVGDFNDVKVIKDTPSETGLEVSKSRIDERGDVKTETLYLIIPAPPAEAEALTVIPASAK